MAGTKNIQLPKKVLYNKTPWMSIQTSTMYNSTKSSSVDIAEIEIDGDIGYYWSGSEDSKHTKQLMKRELKKLSKLDVDMIIVNISSLGGSVDHGVAIHDMLAMHKAKVLTRMVGLCASIATVIAQAGDVRQMSDNAMFLAHMASYVVFAQLNREDLKNMTEDLEVMDRKILDIYAKRSKYDRNKLEQLMLAQSGQGKWIDADEAKSYGLIDEIFEPMQAAALVVDKNQLNKFSLPTNIDTMAKKKKTNDLQDDIDKLLFKAKEEDYIKPPKNQELDEESTTDEVQEVPEIESNEDVEETTEEVQEEESPEEIEEVEKENKETKEEIKIDDFKKMQNQLNSLVSTVNNLKNDKKTLEDKVIELSNKNKSLNSELAKSKAKSTIVPSTPGKENVNDFNIDDKNKSWDRDTNNMKKVFQETHD